MARGNLDFRIHEGERTPEQFIADTTLGQKRENKFTIEMAEMMSEIGSRIRVLDYKALNDHIGEIIEDENYKDEGDAWFQFQIGETGCFFEITADIKHRDIFKKNSEEQSFTFAIKKHAFERALSSGFAILMVWRREDEAVMYRWFTKTEIESINNRYAMPLDEYKGRRGYKLFKDHYDWLEWGDFNSDKAVRMLSRVALELGVIDEVDIPVSWRQD